MSFERLQFMRDAGEVQRFHTERTLRPQCLGNHQWNVAIILLHVMPDAPVHMVKAALYHDVTERETGDMPSPFKWRWPEVKAILDSADDHYREKHGLHVTLTEEERLILKWCDLLELALRCYEERLLGNVFHAAIVRKVMAALNGMPCPPCMDTLYKQLKQKGLHELT